MDPYEPVTLGTSVAVVDLGWASLRETRHEAGFRIAPHSHENATVNFLIEGGFEESIAGTDWDIRPSLVVGKPPGESHANRYGSRGARSLLVEITAAPSSSGAGTALFERPVVFESDLAAAAGRGLARELHLSDPATPLVAEGLLLELFASIDMESTRESTPPSWLGIAIAFIEAHLFEPLRIAEIAWAAGVHPVHLAREFRRHLGVSPGELVRLHRLAWARDRLRCSSLPIASVALAAGFSDQSHLTRLFRARYGISPAVYRRRAASPKERLHPF